LNCTSTNNWLRVHNIEVGEKEDRSLTHPIFPFTNSSSHKLGYSHSERHKAPFYSLRELKAKNLYYAMKDEMARLMKK